MYLAELLTTLTKAMAATFDASYPVPEFRDIYISPEFPIDRANYPGIWVDWEPAGDLTTMGIGHYELSVDDGTPTRKLERWRFEGYGTFTVVSLSSLQRALLFDEAIKVLAFGKEDASRGTFRQQIEDNSRIAISGNFDKVGQRGFANSEGTPWGSTEQIYEATLTLEIVGEFLSDPSTDTLITITAVQVYPILQHPDGSLDPDPTAGEANSNPWM